MNRNYPIEWNFLTDSCQVALFYRLFYQIQKENAQLTFPKQALIWEELNMKSGVRESASNNIKDER